MPVAVKQSADGGTLPPKKYHEPVQGTVYHGDGREERLRAHLLNSEELSESRLNSLHLQERSQRVLEVINEFGKADKQYLMNVGETKGKQIEELIEQHKPKTILEVGAYVGYSAISFARHLKLSAGDVPASQWTNDTEAARRVGYVSLEKSPVYAATARTSVDLAGVGELVQFVIGSSSSSIKTLREKISFPKPIQFDMIFLDHLKPLYTIDIKLLEEEGLIGSGTIILADNVVKPGNPPFLSWVRATPEMKRESLQASPVKDQPSPEPNPDTDEKWEASFRDGPIAETRWAPPEAEGITADGDPSLVYETKMLFGWDPYTGERDACEVIECVGRE